MKSRVIALVRRTLLGVAIGLGLFALYMDALLPVDKKLSLLEADHRETLITAIIMSCSVGGIIGLFWGTWGWFDPSPRSRTMNRSDSIGG